MPPTSRWDSPLLKYMGALRDKLHRIVGYTAFLPDGTGLEFCSRRSKGPFVSSLSRRTISMVLRMSASLKSVPIVEAIAWNRVLSSR